MVPPLSPRHIKPFQELTNPSEEDLEVMMAFQVLLVGNLESMVLRASNFSSLLLSLPARRKCISDFQ